MTDAAPTPDDAPAPGAGDAVAPPGRRRLLRTVDIFRTELQAFCAK